MAGPRGPLVSLRPAGRTHGDRTAAAPGAAAGAAGEPGEVREHLLPGAGARHGSIGQPGQVHVQSGPAQRVHAAGGAV